MIGYDLQVQQRGLLFNLNEEASLRREESYVTQFIGGGSYKL